jgi:hypothetical protein
MTKTKIDWTFCLVMATFTTADGLLLALTEDSLATLMWGVSGAFCGLSFLSALDNVLYVKWGGER